jgi:hypothetical protein
MLRITHFHYHRSSSSAVPRSSSGLGRVYITYQPSTVAKGRGGSPSEHARSFACAGSRWTSNPMDAYDALASASRAPLVRNCLVQLSFTKTSSPRVSPYSRACP